MLKLSELEDVHNVVLDHLGLDMPPEQIANFLEQYDRHQHVSCDIHKWGADDTEVREQICKLFYKVLVGSAKPKHEKGCGDTLFWRDFDAGARSMNFKVAWDTFDEKKRTRFLQNPEPQDTPPERLPLSFDQVKEFLEQVTYKNWTLFLGEDKGGRMYLQVQFMAPCAVTGSVTPQRCRKWWLSPHMTETEIIDTAFKAVLAAEEHEVKESFKYHGRAVYNPHIDIKARLHICDQLEHRVERK